jgi:zinc and cadmium transporter
MNPLGLAPIYCILIVIASLVGGWLPRWLHLSHGRLQTAVSFVAGVLLGIGLLHLLPHGFYQWDAIDAERAIDRSVWWLLIGFLSTFFLQRLFHFHTHETPDALIDIHPVSGEHRHDPSGAHHHPPVAASQTSGIARECGSHHHQFSWGGVFFGLTIHSLVDGVTLAAAIAADWEHGHSGVLAGFGYFLAVLLHKPFDSLSITSLMIASGWSPVSRNVVNVLYALATPIGMAAFFVGMQNVAEAAAILGGILCFAAGACLCISSSDLLPELQFHSHDRLKLSSALLAGLLLAWALVYVENQGHDHHQGPSMNRAVESPSQHDHEHDHDH